MGFPSFYFLLLLLACWLDSGKVGRWVTKAAGRAWRERGR